MKYETRVEIPPWLSVENLQSWMEKINEIGASKLVPDAFGIPRYVGIELELEPGQDLYDLAEMVLGLEVELSAYGEPVSLDRPREAT